MPLIIEILGALVTAAFGFVFRRVVILGLARAAIFVSGYLLIFGTRLGPELGLRAATLMAKAFEEARPTLLGVTGVMLRALMGESVDTSQVLHAGATPALAGGAQAAFDKVIDVVIRHLEPEGALTPESGFRALRGLFNVNMGANLEGWGLGLTADTLTAGRLRALADFHEMIVAGLGFQRLGYRMWQAPIQEAITKPLQRFYAERYTFSLPTAAEAVAGWYAGVYDDAARDSLLRSAGFNPPRALELVNIAQRHLTPQEGVEALRQGLIDEEALDVLLKADKLGPERATLVKALLLGAHKERELQAIATTARELFRAGDLDETTLRQYLAAAHLTEDEQTLAVTADQLAVRKVVLLSRGEILQAYRRGLYTAEAARAALRRRHYADADIDVLFALEVRELDSAQILEGFTRGTTDRDATLRALERLGYSQGDAVALMTAHARTLTEGQVVDALRRGLIGPEVAREDLARLGVDLQTADVLVALGQHTLSAADIQAALVTGLLTETQAHDRLVQLGFSAQDADLYVQLRVRRLTTGQTLDAYAEGLLGRAQAIGDLQQLGLSGPEAQTVVATFDRRAQAKAAQAALRAAQAAARALARQQTPPGQGGTGAPA